MQSPTGARPNRYPILAGIPEGIAFIKEQLASADAAEQEGKERTRRDRLVKAGERAAALLTGLTSAAPLWLALQRQVLIHGWAFGDLEQLDQLAVPTEVNLLKALNVVTPRGSYGPTNRYLEDLVNNATNQVDAVKHQARTAATNAGINLPDPRSGTEMDEASILLVDHAHNQLDNLRSALDELLDAAGRRKLHADELAGLAWLCIQAVIAAAALVTAVSQLADVWPYIERFAADLAQAIGTALDQTAPNAKDGVALLGVVIAIRQSSEGLSGPGELAPSSGGRDPLRPDSSPPAQTGAPPAGSDKLPERIVPRGKQGSTPASSLSMGKPARKAPPDRDNTTSDRKLKR